MIRNPQALLTKFKTAITGSIYKIQTPILQEEKDNIKLLNSIERRTLPVIQT